MLFDLISDPNDISVVDSVNYATDIEFIREKIKFLSKIYNLVWKEDL